MFYSQDCRPGMALIWENEFDMFNIHMGKHAIGVRVFGKDYLFDLEQEAARKERVLFQFADSDNIPEQHRGRWLVMTPDLLSFNIVDSPEDGWKSWGEILAGRTVIVIGGAE